MKEWRKSGKFALISLMCAAALTGGCTSGSTPEETEDDTTNLTVVGFSEVGAESDWRVANTESMKATFTESNGYELLFDDAKQKQENQIAAIRNFILQEVNYIVVDPVVEDGWEGGKGCGHSGDCRGPYGKDGRGSVYGVGRLGFL